MLVKGGCFIRGAEYSAHASISKMSCAVRLGLDRATAAAAAAGLAPATAADTEAGAPRCVATGGGGLYVWPAGRAGGGQGQRQGEARV